MREFGRAFFSSLTDVAQAFCLRGLVSLLRAGSLPMTVHLIFRFFQ